jgi:hypothetical protein
MAQMTDRDKPTFYKIVNTRTGEELAKVSKSKAMATRAKLQKECPDRLEMFLVIED